MSKSRPTQSQMKSLVDLMAKDPSLCAGKFTPTFTQKNAKQKWQVIADQLNALPGAEKSGDKWKKTWQDTRSTTKSKAAAIKRHIRGTGGGPTCDIVLNDVQKDALSLISPSLVSGHENTLESNVEFIFKDPENDILDNDQLCVEEYIDVYDEPNDYETYNQPSPIVPANSIKIKLDTAPIPDITRVNENPNKEQASIVASKPKPDLKRKKTTADCLGESNTAANRLVDIAQRKCDLKEAYYQKKIKIWEENSALLKNLGTTLGTLLTKLTEK